MRRLETLYGSEVLGFYGTAVPKKTVLIIIPGNPGVVDYYDEFCRHIHENLDKKIDIIT